MSLDDTDRVIAPDDIKIIQESLENESLNSTAEKIQSYFSQLDKTVLNIAVTGVSGKGKSTFVNAIRGLGDEEEGSAPTGETETTMEATPYAHPKFPNIELWDLPGIGTEKFQADQYLDQVGFQRYDFFIIISSERFTSNDAQLAREIQKMGKHFYFARSKIDETLRAKAARKSNYNEKETLDLIREDCITGLQKLGVESPRVFLISSFELEKFDFPLLQETMEQDLPQEKKHVFLLALPNISNSVYQKKKKALQANIWRVAMLSGAVAAVPIPGLSFAVDVKILTKEIKKYQQAFGLDEASLRSLADRVKVPVGELKRVTRSSIKEDINDDMVVKMLSKTTRKGLLAAGTQLKKDVLGSGKLPTTSDEVIGSLGKAAVEGLKAAAVEVVEELQNKEGAAEAVLKSLGKVSGSGLMALKAMLSMVPGISGLPAGGIEFFTSYRLLKKSLDELAEDANLVLMKAFPNEGSKVKDV